MHNRLRVTAPPRAAMLLCMLPTLLISRAASAAVHSSNQPGVDINAPDGVTAAGYDDDGELTGGLVTVNLVHPYCWLDNASVSWSTNIPTPVSWTENDNTTFTFQVSPDYTTTNLSVTVTGRGKRACSGGGGGDEDWEEFSATVSDIAINCPDGGSP